MKQEEKIKEANEILKSHLKLEFDETSWMYIDFVLEDRFIHEIQSDKNISIADMTAEELGDYAIEQIELSSRRSRLFGF